MADWKETQEDLERANDAFEAEEAFRFRLQGDNARLREINAELLAALKEISDLDPLEINTSNYDHVDVEHLNQAAVSAGQIADAAVTKAEAGK